MVMGLHSSAPVPPPPPVVWVVWVVVGGGGGGGRSCICMYMNVYVWYECVFLVFVYDYDMIMIYFPHIYIYVYIYILNLAIPENSASLHVPRYQRLFRTKLDHQGRPVRYDIFRRRPSPGGVWVEQGMVMYGNVTLPETNNSPIKNRSISYISSSNHPFSGAKMWVLGSVNSVNDIVIGFP